MKRYKTFKEQEEDNYRTFFVEDDEFLKVIKNIYEIFLPKKQR